MPQKLKVRKISSVDLVPEGSCGEAHITLIKNKEGKGGNSNMNWEELKKSLTPEELALVEAEIAKAKAEMPEDKKKALEDALAAKTTADAEVAKMKGELETLKKSSSQPSSEEDILKNANLDPAVKAILETSIQKAKAAELAIKKMQEEKENQEFVAKAKEVTFIPEADTKVVELLKSVKGVEGAVDKVMDILKAVNTVIAKGGAFKEVGTNGNGTVGVEGSSEQAWAEIEKAADALVVKGQVNKAKAIEIVIDQQPALYQKYVDALRNE
jgi:hypothetical protein